MPRKELTGRARAPRGVAGPMPAARPRGAVADTGAAYQEAATRAKLADARAKELRVAV
jgi:hypothetical protein